MKIIFYLLIPSFLFSNIFSVLAETFEKEEVDYQGLSWELKDDLNSDNNFFEWQTTEDVNGTKGLNNYLIDKHTLKRNFYEVNSLGRGITINGLFYPDISSYIPNAFVENPDKTLTSSFRWISKTRSCGERNFSSNCIDGVLDLDFNLINTENFSFNPKFSIQSLSSRGTSIGEGRSLGFKFARKLTDKYSIAFGGENVIHFDETIDLGRNFYFVTSTFYPLSKNKNSFLFINAGIGSDFYGYRGNGFLGRTSCFGGNTLTGNGTEFCNWGPIGSISIALSERFVIINEWFGYGYGTGISFKPLRDYPLSISIMATDYINDFPRYAKDYCISNLCETRYYGNVSFSF